MAFDAQRIPGRVPSASESSPRSCRQNSATAMMPARRWKKRSANTSKLAKIDVVSSAGYAVIADRLNRESGGIYDARTGELKPQTESKVIENARREFIANEHLDGVVRLRVIHKPGDMRGMDLYMDGVSDSSFGSRTGKGEGWDAVGPHRYPRDTIAAVGHFQESGSCHVRPDAGIQPSAYARDIKGQGVTLVGPRVNELLRDVRHGGLARRCAALVHAALFTARRHAAPLTRRRSRHRAERPVLDAAAAEPVDESPPSPLVSTARPSILKSVQRVRVEFDCPWTLAWLCPKQSNNRS